MRSTSQVIRDIANIYGHYRTNKFIRQKVEHETGDKVSDSLIVQVLGSQKVRMKYRRSKLLQAAMDFYSVCQKDFLICVSLLRELKAANNEN